MADDDTYLVWSNEHMGWWRPGSRGYSRGLRHAGHFSRDQALDICRKAIPSAAHIGYVSEIPVRLTDVQAFIAGQPLPKAIMHDTWEP
jgi:hypothetical protein